MTRRPHSGISPPRTSAPGEAPRGPGSLEPFTPTRSQYAQGRVPGAGREGRWSGASDAPGLLRQHRRAQPLPSPAFLAKSARCRGLIAPWHGWAEVGSDASPSGRPV